MFFFWLLGGVWESEFSDLVCSLSKRKGKERISIYINRFIL